MRRPDHVVVLDFGQVIARGTPGQVQNDPEVVRAYLGAGTVDELRRRFARVPAEYPA